MFLVVLGITLFLSYISVRIRDIPQLTGVITRLLFFLTPIIFPMEIFPHSYRFLLFFNPFTAITQGFRSVVLYNQAPNVLSLIYPTVLGLVLVYAGYLFFKANERNLVDYI
jgi:ABC-type polysaccharide/polyol phosphate export permease